MRIANVAIRGMNKYRARVRDWLEKRRPDVLTLQKIGLNEEFCEKEFLEVGYWSKYVGGRSGPRSPVGVAILSHRALPRPKVCARGLKGAKHGESGFLTVDIGGLWVSSVYVPYCEERRVAWLRRMRNHVRDEAYHRRDSVLCGDFNVKFKADGPRGSGYTHKHENALKELMSLGFSDLYRATYPDPTKHPGRTCDYSRINPKVTARLHLALASASLTLRRQDVWLDVDSRPRDDAPPLVVEFGRGRARHVARHLEVRRRP